MVVAGLAAQPQSSSQKRTRAYILEDASVHGLTPLGWAERVVAVFKRWHADRVVVEVNQGGDLVTNLLHTVDKNIPIKAVRATRGKILRAEPVAALYEQKRVFHAGKFSALEDQMTQFTGAGGETSPDRLDALVWTLTDLILNGSTPPVIRAL